MCTSPTQGRPHQPISAPWLLNLALSPQLSPAAWCRDGSCPASPLLPGSPYPPQFAEEESAPETTRPFLSMHSRPRHPACTSSYCSSPDDPNTPYRNVFQVDAFSNKPGTELRLVPFRLRPCRVWPLLTWPTALLPQGQEHTCLSPASSLSSSMSQRTWHLLPPPATPPPTSEASAHSRPPAPERPRPWPSAVASMCGPRTPPGICGNAKAQAKSLGFLVPVSQHRPSANLAASAQ